MAAWVRFESGGEVGFGRIEGDRIAVHQGNLFETRSRPARSTAATM